MFSLTSKSIKEIYRKIYQKCANYYLKEEAKTLKGKEYTLLNIPYFHASKLEKYLE
jgi:hypothetical protein